MRAGEEVSWEDWLKMRCGERWWRERWRQQEVELEVEGERLLGDFRRDCRVIR